MAIESNLQTWCSEKQGYREHKARLTAVERIRECFERAGKSLDLSGLRLTSLPFGIGQIRSLNWLCLQNNALTSIPMELYELGNDCRIYLGNCRLTDVVLEEIENSDHYDGPKFYLGKKRSLEDIPDPCSSEILDSLHELREYSLPAWCEEKKGDREYPQRIEAAKRIRDCFNNNHQTLDLSYSSLTSLPSMIGQLSNLKEFFLTGNQLVSLPVEIGKLVNLKSLHLEENNLTALPEEILQLKNLQTLDLTENEFSNFPVQIIGLSNLLNLFLDQSGFTSLPEGFCALSKLESLGLSYNGFKEFPAAILQLTALKSLDLAGNYLTSIPVKIGALSNLEKFSLAENGLDQFPNEILQLTSLKTLDLPQNKLTTLPSEIQQFINLEEIDLNGNAFSTFPSELYNLPRSCAVSIIDNDLTEDDWENIRARIGDVAYTGPRIQYSIEQDLVDRTSSLEELLEKLYKLSQKERPEFKNLFATVDLRQSMREWLAKLCTMADFNAGGAGKEALVQKITEYLELADSNESYRNLFNSTIEDASKTCGDRMALSVIHLGLAKYLASIDLSDTDALAQFLLNTVWIVDQLENIARDKILVLRARNPLGKIDEIEVYLAYLIKLKERLHLNLDVSEMLYFRCSDLSDKDLDQAFKRVVAKRGDFEEQCAFLASQELWRKALWQKEPESFEKAQVSEDPLTALIELTKQIHGMSSI